MTKVITSNVKLADKMVYAEYGSEALDNSSKSSSVVYLPKSVMLEVFRQDHPNGRIQMLSYEPVVLNGEMFYSVEGAIFTHREDHDPLVRLYAFSSKGPEEKGLNMLDSAVSSATSKLLRFAGYQVPGAPDFPRANPGQSELDVSASYIELNGEDMPYMPLRALIYFFRLKYPEAKIEIEHIEQVPLKTQEDHWIATCSIYLDRRDSRPAATTMAEGTYMDRGEGVYGLDIAVSNAIREAIRVTGMDISSENKYAAVSKAYAPKEIEKEAFEDLQEKMTRELPEMKADVPEINPNTLEMPPSGQHNRRVYEGNQAKEIPVQLSEPMVAAKPVEEQPEHAAKTPDSTLDDDFAPTHEKAEVTETLPADREPVQEVPSPQSEGMITPDEGSSHDEGSPAKTDDIQGDATDVSDDAQISIPVAEDAPLAEATEPVTAEEETPRNVRPKRHPQAEVAEVASEEPIVEPTVVEREAEQSLPAEKPEPEAPTARPVFTDELAAALDVIVPTSKFSGKTIRDAISASHDEFLRVLHYAVTEASGMEHTFPEFFKAANVIIDSKIFA